MVKKIPAWRKEFGKAFDPTMAYVDMLVINGYTGAGETRLWLDDLEIAGVLDPTYGKQNSTKSSTENDAARDSGKDSAERGGPQCTLANGEQGARRPFGDIATTAHE